MASAEVPDGQKATGYRLRPKQLCVTATASGSSVRSSRKEVEERRTTLRSFFVTTLHKFTTSEPKLSGL